MAKKKKARAKPSGQKKAEDKKAAETASDEQAASALADTPPAPRRDIRPYIYAFCDVVMVSVWSVLLLTAIPTRHGWAKGMLWLMVVLVVVMGAAMFVRNKWGWRSAAIAAGIVLLMWVALIIMVLSGAAYLAGVYGAFGRAAAMGTVVIGLLTIQLVALVPALQLKFLLTRAGRRYFNLEPLWR